MSLLQRKTLATFKQIFSWILKIWFFGLFYSWSLFCFLLITDGVQIRLQRNNSLAFRNHLFGIPTILEKNFSLQSKGFYNMH